MTDTPVRTKRRLAGRRTFALLSLCVIIQGCDLGYFARGAYQEARLLWKRRPISAELNKPDLARELRTKLELVLAVRKFAAERLGLNVGGAYSTITPVDAGAVTWIVMAAPKTSLTPYTWWFPIVGSVPYRGYFSQSAAAAEAAGLDGKGYDTLVRSAVAFSTLGFFNDPVLSNLLRLDQVQLAGVIIHELFHRTFFLPSSVMFDESAADYIGARGAIDFFAGSRGAASPEAAEARAILASDLKFADFLQSQEARLLRLYGSGRTEEEILKRRPRLFAAIQADYARLKPELSGMERFDLDTQPLNNAVLLNYRIYFHDLNEFAAIDRIHNGDLRATIEAVIELAKSDPYDPFFALWQAAEQAPKPPP